MDFEKTESKEGKRVNVCYFEEVYISFAELPKERG